MHTYTYRHASAHSDGLGGTSTHRHANPGHRDLPREMHLPPAAHLCPAPWLAPCLRAPAPTGLPSARPSWVECSRKPQAPLTPGLHTLIYGRFWGCNVLSHREWVIFQSFRSSLIPTHTLPILALNMYSFIQQTTRALVGTELLNKTELGPEGVRFTETLSHCTRERDRAALPVHSVDLKRTRVLTVVFACSQETIHTGLHPFIPPACPLLPASLGPSSNPVDRTALPSSWLQTF